MTDDMEGEPKFLNDAEISEPEAEISEREERIDVYRLGAEPHIAEYDVEELCVLIREARSCPISKSKEDMEKWLEFLTWGLNISKRLHFAASDRESESPAFRELAIVTGCIALELNYEPLDSQRENTVTKQFIEEIGDSCRIIFETQYAPLRRCQSMLSMVRDLPILQTHDYVFETDENAEDVTTDPFLTHLEHEVWDWISGFRYGKSGTSIRDGVARNKQDVLAALKRFVKIEICEIVKEGYRPIFKHRGKSGDQLIEELGSSNVTGTGNNSGTESEPS